MRKIQFAAQLCAALAFGHAIAADNADTVVDTRARTLLSTMTLDEKVQLVHGACLGMSPLGSGGFIAGIPRLGIPDLNFADSATGVNAGASGATAFPSPLAVAASWDTALAQQLGVTAGKELRNLGFAVSLGTGVNFGARAAQRPNFRVHGRRSGTGRRDADGPYTGTQAQKVVATAKHFIANEHETNRFESNSVISERVLRELYLLPSEMTIRDEQPGNVLWAYNLINGVKACENKALLTDILKTEWGFKGTVQADWIFALTDTVRGANAGWMKNCRALQMTMTAFPACPRATSTRS